MNLQDMQNSFSQIKAFRPIGRTVLVGDAVCHLAGLMLKADGALELLILEYQDELRERMEEAWREATPPARRDTNRAVLVKSGKQVFLTEVLSHVVKVSFGAEEFHAKGSAMEPCYQGSWANAALLTRLLMEGWVPHGLETQALDGMFLTRVQLGEGLSAIPDVDIAGPIRLSVHPRVETQPVEMPIVLTIGEEYEKMMFVEKETGLQHWFRILRVSLYDPWEIFDQNLSLSEEQRAQSEAHLTILCPRGMRLVYVEYECEDLMRIDLYSAAWLDAKPERKSGGSMSVGYQSGKDAPKVAVVQALVIPADARQAEAELFLCHTTIPQDDIVF